MLVLMMVLLPLASAVAVWLSGRAAKQTALGLALLHLLLTGFLVSTALAELNERGAITTTAFEPIFVPGDPCLAGEETHTHRTTWTLLSLQPSVAPESRYSAGANIQFFLGIDGLNLWLVALCSLMMIVSILVSWTSITDRAAAYYAWLFVLQAGAIGAFLSFDVILFYVFFEITLIPSFFLIGYWGSGSARRDAARKFFLYTLAGSLLMLVGLVGIVITNPLPNGQITFSLPDLMLQVQYSLETATKAALQGKPEELSAKHTTQIGLFFLLMAGLAVKTPIWPLHTWLPGAYGEAHLGTTVMLSSLLSKLGTFGILRFVLALTPDAAITHGLPVVGGFAAFGIIYAALCAFAQRDMKLMIAYSSVSHLGFLVLGLFAFNAEGIAGASLHMVNHGLTTGALFAMLGFFWNRYRTTDIHPFGGMIGRFPRFAFFAFVLVLASIGLPSLNNFVSEMMMLAGIVDARNPGAPGLFLAVIAAFSIFLSAWYMLTMMQKVFFNPLREPPTLGGAPAADMNGRERLVFAGLSALCLGLGLFPQALLKPMQSDVAKLDAIALRARVRTGELKPLPPIPVKAAPAPKTTRAKTPAKTK